MSFNFPVILFISALSGLSAILLGASGAHLLSHLMDAYERYLFLLANIFHFLHTLFLVLLAFLYEHKKNSWLIYSMILIGFGTLLFSGSLYLYATTHIKMFSSITPPGGFALILGWVTFGIAALTMRKQAKNTQ